MSQSSRAAADRFMCDETEFHLGFLPTEQSNPRTKTLEADFQADTAQGVLTIRRADRVVAEMAHQVLAGAEYQKLLAAGKKTLDNGGRIIFSGCGATGRLSILLESMFREFARNTPGFYAENQCESIMTGGDFALIRSVEFFEDYQSFGRKQVEMTDMTSRDMLVAITEGGETSSVIGTVKEACDRGCAVFMMFNNPAKLLRDHLVRCREVIDDPRVTVLDLSCGPMTLAGSTRMQATTSEELVAGAFLEDLVSLKCGTPKFDWATEFDRLLDELESAPVVADLAKYIDFESEIYRHNALVTYYANDYLLDLFTDTTERNPTFMLPPFKSKATPDAPQSWAFVKNPLYSTPETWRHMLKRSPRTLSWSKPDYLAMGSGEAIAANPPKISERDLYMIEVGSEAAPERFARSADRAVVMTVENAPGNAALLNAAPRADYELKIRCSCADSPLQLMKHLAVKLALNTISTGTMAKIGRITGNWMSFVSVSNKKLVDRAIRLISELGKVDYPTAAYTLFESIEETEHLLDAPSPVQHALRKLRNC